MSKFNILIFILLVGSLMLLAEDVAAQAEVNYTVLPVTNISTSGNSWNLSECEPAGAEFDIQKVMNDKGVSIYTPAKRLDFVGTNDSTSLVGTETRQYRVEYSPGIPVTQNGLAAGFNNFTFKGRIYQRDYLHGTGTTTGVSEQRGRLLSASGDEIKDGRMLHRTVSYRWVISNDSIMNLASLPDSLFCTTRVDDYMFMAPGRDFPIAFKQVSEYSNRDGVIYSDSTAWIVTYDPLETALYNDRKFRALTGRDTGRNVDNGGYVGIVRAVVEGNELQVTLTVNDENGLPLTIATPVRAVITDVLGRSYIDTSIGADSHGVINIESLPRGQYLLQVIYDNARIEPVKFLR